MKICKHCNIEKELKDFVGSKLTLDGTISTCKTCSSTMRSKKRYSVTLIEKTCFCCKQTKIASDFSKNASLIGGLHTWCKECCTNKHKVSEYAKKSNIVRKEKIKSDPIYRENINNQKRKSRIKRIASVLLQECKRRAIKKNLEFNISIEDIIIPEICPILLQPIIQGTKDNYKFSPSIDRIDNNKGYIKGNIQVISMKANTIKNSATIEELLLFAKWVNDTFKTELNIKADAATGESWYSAKG
jgi:hypothetical protein